MCHSSGKRYSIYFNVRCIAFTIKPSLFHLYLFLAASAVACSEFPYQVNWIEDQSMRRTIDANDPENLIIFCYRGEKRHLFNIWKTINVRVPSHLMNYEAFQGDNASAVFQLYQESNRLLSKMSVGPLLWKSRCFSLPVYNASCIGVHADDSTVIFVDIHRVDFWKCLRLASGVFLFFAAPYLSSNVVFYYSSGVAIGFLASFLIIVFVLSRFVPGKIGAATVLVGGWALALYCLQLLFSNLKAIALKYQSFVLGYFVIVGFLSFAICYKYGQITDPRTRNLIKWMLQGVALLLVFLSSEWQEANMCIILMMLTFHMFPAKWSAYIRTYWRKRFPPKIRLLTEDEYHEQSAVFTRKSLEELRYHCQSPKCDSWKLVKSLKSPVRFAEFINGSSHLTDDEVLDYEMEQSRTLNDDSFSSDSEDDSVM